MLTQERFDAILNILKRKHTVTVTELTEFLDASESTIRRDLNTLDHKGLLIKVHGGATEIQREVTTVEDDVSTKQRQNVEEKTAIAKYAATLVQKDDFIYIDAGTTTERIVDYLEEGSGATFVTNGIVHAKKLIQKGFKAYVIGGELKLSTEAIIGAEAINNLKKYNFNKGFIGANGIAVDSGYSTPDVEEALLKAEAVTRSYTAFVLADHTKFGRVNSVSFADLGRACIVTDLLPDQKYMEHTVIKEVAK